MKRRKKKKIRWGRILFLFIILVCVILGGLKINSVMKNRQVKERKVEKRINEKDGLEEKTNQELEKAPSTYLEFQNLEDGDYVTTHGYTLKIKNGIAYIDDYIIVNKTYSVPSSYQPDSPYRDVTGERCNDCINKDAMESFRLMKSDAQSLGLNIYISSGYRSYSYQDRIYHNYVSVSGKEIADTYSARPGHSEHQTGTCFDLNTIDDSFQYTNEGKWVNENASLYGFIIRYPKGKESITGYQYESWHLRYVGKDLAQKLYQEGNWLTLEEYYGISSKYE